MKTRTNYKPIITLCIIYEIIAFLVLFTHDTCDLLFYPCGLQYVILCFIIPILVALLWFWKKELFGWSKLVQKLSSYIIYTILFICLGIYLCIRPTILNFNNRSLVYELEKTVKEQCIKEHAKSPLPKTDVQTKCSELGLRMNIKFSWKVVTPKQIGQQLNQEKEALKDYPFYATKLCDSIVKRERDECNKIRKDGYYCNCYGNTVAFYIKKDYNLRYYNDAINRNLSELRRQAIEYCDKEQKNNKLRHRTFNPKEFCDLNDI